MALIVFCVGLRTRPGDILSLFGKPARLLRSLFAMNVVMPAIAAAVAAFFNLNPALLVALIALAVSPVPPILPGKEVEAGGSESYAVALLALSALLAIVFVPAAIHILSMVFSHPAQVQAATIARIVLVSVLVPLLIGVAVQRWVPAIAARLARPVSTIGWIALVLGCLPVLVKVWPALMALVGDFTLVAIVAITLAGLAVGHWLGGPDAKDRTALALSTACRHPGVAIAIVHANSPDDHSVTAAILLAFLVSTVATIPYVKWRKRAHAQVQS
jgi:BASS family bile acid:Na+ symporter